jgi:hypothetical protein
LTTNQKKGATENESKHETEEKGNRRIRGDIR